MKRSIAIFLTVAALALLLSCSKIPCMTARVNHNRWVNADPDVTFAGRPVLSGGYKDDGSIIIEGFGWLYEGNFCTGTQIRIELERAEVGRYEISPRVANEVEFVYLRTFDRYHSTDGSSNGWVTIDKIKKQPGLGFVRGRFSVTIECGGEELKVRNGRYRVPLYRVMKTPSMLDMEIPVPIVE